MIVYMCKLIMSAQKLAFRTHYMNYQDVIYTESWPLRYVIKRYWMTNIIKVLMAANIITVGKRLIYMKYRPLCLFARCYLSVDTHSGIDSFRSTDAGSGLWNRTKLG